MEDKSLLKAMKYVAYLQKGNKPRFPAEAIRYLAKILQTIEKLSANKTRFQLTIGVTTPEGNIKVNLLENCGYVFHELFPVILTTPSTGLINTYFQITTQFLLCNNISALPKTQIIDFEHQYFKELLENAFITNSEGLKALKARINLCGLALENPGNEVFGDEDSIKNILSSYISKALSIFVNNGQLLQAANFLSFLLENSKSISEKLVLVKQIISHNTSYNLTSNAELNSLIDEYEEEYSEEDVGLMRAEVNADPNSMTVSFFSFGNGNLSLKSTKGKDITTIIRFSIPNVCTENAVQKIKINDKTLMILSPVVAFWTDPMFKTMNRWKIANMGWSHFCDVEAKEGKNYTHVQVIIKGLFIPDVELTEDSNIGIDYSDKEALMGRSFYPHKEFIIRTILDNLNVINEHLEIDKKDVNINLFSNYIVQIIDNSTSDNIYQKLFAITNPDSYSKTATRFIERLNSINLADSLINVRDLLVSTKIESEKNLMEFVRRCIELFVKHNIENHGGYNYLWKRDEKGILKPNKEPESQPYIFSHLRAIFDFMGIQISREVESSNGEIDFLLSFNNSNNKLLRLCVELKLAQATKIEEGLTKQLPAYMKGERCKYGIYLVLWYKGDSFDRPTKYASVSELQSRFNSINYSTRISSMIINCSKPTSPSKLK